MELAVERRVNTASQGASGRFVWKVGQVMLNGASKSSHAAFQVSRDPLQAARQMKLSIAVMAFLSLAIGLGASAISPHAGWIEGVSPPHKVFNSLVDARASMRLPQG